MEFAQRVIKSVGFYVNSDNFNLLIDFFTVEFFGLNPKKNELNF